MNWGRLEDEEEEEELESCGADPWLCQDPAPVHGGGFPVLTSPETLPHPQLPAPVPHSGLHLLLLEVHKRLLIYRQKLGKWNLSALGSMEDEAWWCEALLSPE